LIKAIKKIPLTRARDINIVFQKLQFLKNLPENSSFSGFRPKNCKVFEITNRVISNT